MNYIATIKMVRSIVTVGSMVLVALALEHMGISMVESIGTPDVNTIICAP